MTTPAPRMWTYDDLFVATEIAFLVTTPDLVMVDANAAYLRGVGRTRADLLGRDVFTVFGNSPLQPDVDQAAMVRDSMRAAVAEGRTDRLVAVRYDIPTADGEGFEVRWWNITNTAVVDAAGATVALLHHTDDITALIEERRAGEVVTAANERLQERIARAQADLLARAADLHALNAQLRAASAHDRRVAEALQQAMLTRLPEPAGLDLVARYRTAARDDKVGGDWYDALVLPNGSTVVVVGDVMGHDIHAAGLMGQLRSMLRAFAWDTEQPPSTIVAQLDRALRDLRIETMATLVTAVVEQDGDQVATGRHTVRWTNAGHPPPLLVDPAGRVTVLDAVGAGDGRVDPLLGVRPDAVRRDLTVEVSAGSMLVLYTDGLVETRDAGIDDGLARLEQTLRDHHGLGPEDLVDTVLDELVGRDPVDDVVVLLVHFLDAGRAPTQPATAWGAASA